jgi:adenylate cyclase
MGKAFIQPVRLLQQTTEEIADGNFKLKLDAETGDEFDLLFETYNMMIKGLNEREELTSYLSKDVLSEVSQENDILLPGGERALVSIVFCSIPRAAKLHAANNAEQVLTHLGRLIDVADEISRNHNGVIDKVIEDTIMIVFRQSDAGFSHVKAACQTTLEISKRFSDSEQVNPIAAGIASGMAISGKIGSKAGKLDYTVIGNPVNLAARLKSQAHIATQTGILLCPQTIRYLKGSGKLRFIDRIVIKGRTRTFPMYELLALRQEKN